MKKIIIKKTEDEFWNRVSVLLNLEKGNVHEIEQRDGITHYNANFPIYGGFFLGIPESVVEIVE